VSAGGELRETVALTILADDRTSTVEARLDDRSRAADSSRDGAATSLGAVRISAGDLERALGFELKPEGLCKGELCLPIGSRPGLVASDGIDLVALADLLERPLALDVAEGGALLGESARQRSAALRSLEAPDFRLPDLDGRERALSDHRGRKVFLLAFASW
jgi:hypothetical protein